MFRPSVRRLRATAFLVTPILLISTACSGPTIRPGPAADPYQARTNERMVAASTLAFVPNRGQLDPQVSYHLSGPDSSVYFTSSGLTFTLDGWALKLDFLGANRTAPVGTDRTHSVVNYLMGSRDEWETGIPTFGSVTYRDLWPGVDLRYSTGSGSLKYELVVDPGADPGDIRLRYRGASSMALDSMGRLRVATPRGSLHDAPPVAYQEGWRGRTPVQARYVADGANTFGFAVGPYDAGRTLVIDPEVLVFGSFLGGGQEDVVLEVAVDATGSVYGTGYTRSGDTFPVTPGSFDEDHGGSHDAFVVKFTPDGSALAYATFLGGERHDEGLSIAIDGNGNAYVTGTTNSEDFPLTPNALDDQVNSESDPFVAMLNADGSDLLFGTFLGGRQFDLGAAIAVDASAKVFVAGITLSSDFPVTPDAFDTEFNGTGASDGYVAKIDPAAESPLNYSTFLGGAGDDESTDVTVDGSGQAYSTGVTESDDFPTTLGALDGTFNGADDGFVTKLASSGSDLVFSTYLGGDEDDVGTGIALDGSTNVYLTGYTESQDFPVTPNAFDPKLEGVLPDGFVAKLLPSGASLVYSSYLGGAEGDDGQDIAVDRRGRATIVGQTTSEDFPVTQDAFQPEKGGVLHDGFVTTVRAGGGGLVASTYLGGLNSDGADSVAVDRRGISYVSGKTYSSNFPTTPGAFDTGFDGDTYDGFVAKLDPTA